MGQDVMGDVATYEECYNYSAQFILPEDLNKENPTKHYASEVLRIEELNEYNFDLLHKESLIGAEKESQRIIINHTLNLLSMNDWCDKQGVAFLSKVFDSALNNSKIAMAFKSYDNKVSHYAWKHIKVQEN